MHLPVLWGYISFVAIPTFLWLLGALAVRRRPFPARLAAFVAGSDNRLSLSRLQAFAWTLVIFGSFAAAMLVHTHITSDTDIRTGQAAAAAQLAFEKTTSDLKIADTKLSKMESLLNDAKTAWAIADVTAQNSRALAAGSTGSDRDAALKKAASDQQNEATLSVTMAGYQSAYENALKERNDAQGKRNKAEIEAKSTSSDWVKIPAALLALAGIAIGSGVFSSLIAGVNSDAKTACITALKRLTPDDLKARFPDANSIAGCDALVIEGAEMGSAGRVRLGTQPAPILFWDKNGNNIAVDLSEIKKAPDGIVIETSNGKLAYSLSGPLHALALGLPAFKYDLADLFRDDKNPSIFSLMKFQMFGWTVIAIGIYTWIFLSNLSPEMSALPLVDPSIVILTGLSQSGYLAGKAISSVGQDPPK
jgi:hypothetical protein